MCDVGGLPPVAMAYRPVEHFFDGQIDVALDYDAKSDTTLAGFPCQSPGFWMLTDDQKMKLPLPLSLVDRKRIADPIDDGRIGLPLEIWIWVHEIR